MKITCPDCGFPYDLAPDYIGKNVECTSCGRKFVVANPNLFPCPECFALISKRAAVCPHCGAPMNEPKIHSASGGKATGEESEIDRFNPSAMAYIWWIVLGVLTIPVLFGILILIFVFIDIKCTTYLLTNRRLVVKRGLISKKQDEVWICDIRGVNMDQGIWQRIIGIGNVSVGTAATSGKEIIITDVRNPEKLIGLINSLRAQ